MCAGFPKSSLRFSSSEPGGSYLVSQRGKTRVEGPFSAAYFARCNELLSANLAYVASCDYPHSFKQMWISVFFFFMSNVLFLDFQMLVFGQYIKKLTSLFF